MTRSILPLLLLVALNLPGVADARSAVVRVTGDRSGRIAGSLANVLGQHLSVIDGERLEMAIRDMGLRGPLTNRINANGVGRAGTDLEVAATQVGAEVVLMVDIKGKRRRRNARMVLYDVVASSVVDDKVVSIRRWRAKPRRATLRRFVKTARRMLTELPPAPPPPPPEEELALPPLSPAQELEPPPITEEEAPEVVLAAASPEEDATRLASLNSYDNPGGPGPEMTAEKRVENNNDDDDDGEHFFINPQVGWTYQGRNMSYTNARDSNYFFYSGFHLHGVHGSCSLQPLALIDSTAWYAGIGVDGVYEHSIGAESEVDDSVTLETNLTQWRVGGHYALRLSILTIRPRVHYGTLSFSFSDPGGALNPNFLPGVEYTFIEAGGDLELDLDPVRIFGGASYRHILTTGMVGDSFAGNANTLGISSRFGIALELFLGLEVVATGRFDWFSYTVPSGSAAHAEGAEDMYYGVEAALAWPL